MRLQKEFKNQGDFLFKNRSFFPLIIIVVGLLVFIEGHQTAFKQSGDDYYGFACIVVSLFGLAIRFIVIGYSADKTSGRNTKVGQVADSINTTGLYSVCRHPLYLGNFFMWIGVAMFTQNFWFLIAFTFLYQLYYERIMYAEESYLTEKYGKKYIDWANTTPAFIPNFSLWKASDSRFNWIKIIRKEKSGILNLSIMIFIFKSLNQYLHIGQLAILSAYWFWGLILSSVYYGLIKLLQKKTSYLVRDR